MTSLIANGCRDFSSCSCANVRHLFSQFRLAAVLGLMVGTLALVPPVPAQAQDHAYCAATSSDYVPGHMYLNNADGTVTDVTASYVQIGTIYDAQKGYTVQTGTVTTAASNSIDVTVDVKGGTVGDWGGKSIGFIAPQKAPTVSCKDQLLDQSVNFGLLVPSL